MQGLTNSASSCFPAPYSTMRIELSKGVVVQSEM